jgi:uncharacterized membrane protein YbhN (UPF0104 family)
MGQAALLAAGTNLATAIPAAPGYVGTFELAAVTIGASVGIAKEDALAFAILVHVTTLLLTSIGGAIAFALGQRSRSKRVTASVDDNGRTTDPAAAAVPPPAADEVVARTKGA